MRRAFRLIVALSVAWLGVAMLARGQDAACPDDALPARLTVGEGARVLYDHSVNLRPEPTTQIARLDVLGAGARLDVLEGPTCADGYRWWRVEVIPYTPIPDDAPLTGWLAEGDPADGVYWLEPRGIIAMIEDADGTAREVVIDADGAIIERAGCMTPPDDMTRVTWGGAAFNARTVAMLRHADRLYKAAGGSLMLEWQVVQGSYNPGAVEASFGTHDGGGAVDISVRDRADFSVAYDEIPLMLDALRVAGFAAWLRDFDELYAGSPIHIHAIAVGDPELSPAARRQIDGPEGYLRGYNGLPVDAGAPPYPDIYGEPVICAWMRAAGFDDLR